MNSGMRAKPPESLLADRNVAALFVETGGVYPESFEQASRAIQTLKDTPPFTNRYVKL